MTLLQVAVSAALLCLGSCTPQASGPGNVSFDGIWIGSATSLTGRTCEAKETYYGKLLKVRGGRADWFFGSEQANFPIGLDGRFNAAVGRIFVSGSFTDGQANATSGDPNYCVFQFSFDRFVPLPIEGAPSGQYDGTYTGSALLDLTRERRAECESRLEGRSLKVEDGIAFWRFTTDGIAQMQVSDKGIFGGRAGKFFVEGQLENRVARVRTLSRLGCPYTFELRRS